MPQKVIKVIKKIAEAGGGCLIALGLLLSAGCSDARVSSDSLLRPPRPTGDKAAIQEVISAQVGGSYTLKYPQQGEYRSAVILRNEGTADEYALALYTTENDTRLNASIIAGRDNGWHCIGSFANNGSGVDRVMFYDIDGDKKEEVLIGWTAYNTSRKSLTAYSIGQDEVYEMTIDEAYDELVVTDMTNDRSDDIVLLSLSTQEQPSKVVLLQYSDQDQRPVGNCSLELDAEVTSFANVQVGEVAVHTEPLDDTSASARTETSGQSGQAESSKPKVSKPESSKPESSKSEVSKSEASKSEVSGQESSVQEAGLPETSQPEASEPEIIEPETVGVSRNTRGIVVDGKRSDNTFCTQMIYFDQAKGELINPIDPLNKVSKNNFSNPTLRTDAVFCQDINGDNVIDIPMVSQMNASVDENPTAVCTMTSWSNYDASTRKMITVENTVMNLKDGYCFTLPERWVGAVTARSNAETRELSFYLWNSKTASLGDRLLTVYRFNEQQWKDNKNENLLRLELQQENKTIVCAVELLVTSAADAMNLSESELQQAIRAL